MIDDPLHLATAFVTGLVLGALYLGVLWFTVRRLPRARNPGLWILGSAAGRIGVLFAAWYWVSAGNWQALIACLLGFLLVRSVATRIARAGMRPSAPLEG
jgi:F1F0 ATPase subunit 2